MKLNLIIILGILILIMGIGSASAENPYLDPMVIDRELVAEKSFNGFTTSWYYSPGLVSQEYIIAVQNLEDINRETDISSFISETSFDIDGISNIQFSEYKNVSYTYLVYHYDEVEHSEWNEANQSWTNWTEQVFSHTTTETAEKPDWKACKMNTFSQGVNDRKEDYGNMLIPKFTSKDKGDGTIDGTKIFKLSFDTPITDIGVGFGSEGRVALTLDNIEHCPYWNESWDWRFFVTYNQSAVAGTQNSIPAHFFFNMDGLKVDGADIRLTYENGTAMPREVEYYNSTSNNGSIFLLANLSDTGFWFYGGNDAATEPAIDSAYGSQAVWDANYKAVWHMNNDPNGDAASSIKDSTSNANHGTPVGSMTTADLVYTDYGQAIDLDGGNDYINMGDIDFTTVFHATAVAELTTFNNYNSIFCKPHTNGAWSSPYANYMLRADSLPSPITRPFLSPNSVIQGGSSEESITAGNEHIYTMKWDSTSEDVFSKFDGGSDVNVDSTAPGTLPNRASDLDIGRDESAVGFWTGPISELWFSDSIRSSDYDLTHHRNLKNPSASGTAPFYSSIGSKEYPLDSLHYNASAPYNHTIASDGSIISNRSVVAADDTNDTAVSTGTSYLVLNVFNNSADIVRNFTFTGDDLDWYQAANLTAGDYDLKNSSGIIETQSDGNFTTNLVAGTYWIEEHTPPEPFTPPNPVSLSSTVYQDNYTVIWTWAAGSGNVTDTYNVSVNGSWTNGSANTSYTHVLGDYGTSTIEVWAYNSSASGTLSAGSASGSQEIKEITPLLFNIFIVLALLALILTGYSVLYEDLMNFTHIICGFLATLLWIILGYQAYIGIGFQHVIADPTYVNGSLTSIVDTVEVTTYQYPWFGMLFVLVGVIMALYTILQAINANKDLIEELEDKDRSDEYRSE